MDLHWMVATLMDGYGEYHSSTRMLGIPDPGAAMHRMARISDFGAASNAPNANSMLDLGTTHSGLVFKWWEDIKEYMVDVDINDLALSLPQPTAKHASDVVLQPIPLSSPNPSKPSPQPMSNSNATPHPRVSPRLTVQEFQISPEVSYSTSQSLLPSPRNYGSSGEAGCPQTCSSLLNSSHTV